MKLPNRHDLPNYLPLLIGIVFVLIFQIRKLNQFPLEQHSWTQMDYYAAADKFAKKSLNIFYPRTYSLTKLDSDSLKWKKGGNSDITRMDFPLHSWTAGLIMKITKQDGPFTFRTFSLLINILGLFYLFRLMRHLHLKAWSVLLVLGMLLLSPMYAEYMSGTMASSFAFPLVCIAYYYFIRYIGEKKFKHFLIAIILLGITTAFRTSFAIFLIATICYQALDYMIQRKIIWKEVVTYLLIFALPISLFFHNLSIEMQYGSIFLTRPIPPNSWVQVKDILSVVNENKYMSFTTYHLIFIVLSIITLTITLLLGNKFTEKYFKYKLQSFSKKILLLSGIALFGSLLFGSIMMNAFIQHDYYTLDLFFIPMLLLWICLLTIKPTRAIPPKWNQIFQIGASVVVVVILVATYIPFKKTYDYRMGEFPWSINIKFNKHAKNAQKALDKLAISEKENIIIFESPSPNLGGAICQRNTYFEEFNSKLKHTFPYKGLFDGALVENRFFDKLLRNSPGVIPHLKAKLTDGEMIYFTNEKSANLMEMISPIADIQFHAASADSSTSIYWAMIDKKEGELVLDKENKIGQSFTLMMPSDQLPETVIYKVNLKNTHQSDNQVLIQYAIEAMDREGLYGSIQTDLNCFDDFYGEIKLPKWDQEACEIKLFVYLQLIGEDRVEYGENEIWLLNWKPNL